MRTSLRTPSRQYLRTALRTPLPIPPVMRCTGRARAARRSAPLAHASAVRCVCKEIRTNLDIFAEVFVLRFFISYIYIYIQSLKIIDYIIYETIGYNILCYIYYIIYIILYIRYYHIYIYIYKKKNSIYKHRPAYQFIYSFIHLFIDSFLH